MQPLLGDVAKGGDPAAVKLSKRQAKTVAELCDLYIADAEAGRLLTRRKIPKKASTLVIDRLRIDSHVKPLLGQQSVAAVTREDIDQFMHDVAAGKAISMTKSAKSRASGGKGTASRTVGMLGAIFAYAVRHRMRPDNPVRGVVLSASPRASATDGSSKRNTGHLVLGCGRPSLNTFGRPLSPRLDFSRLPDGGAARRLRCDGPKSISTGLPRFALTPKQGGQYVLCRTRLAMCCATLLDPGILFFPLRGAAGQ